MSAAAQKAEPPAPQKFRVSCECGKKLVGVFGHYDRKICPCGRGYWALQPKREGPLAIYPWPGPNFTRTEMEGRA